MAKITFDVSGSDPDKATQDIEPPKPGVYVCKVAEINPGFSKNDDGKPDKSRPRLEVVYRINKGPSKGAPLWDYLSFSDASQWKLDQFLQAVGVASSKKRKGSFDPATIINKKLVKVRVTGQGSGEDYRARVRGVFAYDPDEDESDEEPEDDDATTEEPDDDDAGDGDDDDNEIELDEDDLDQLGAEADAGGDPGDIAQARLTELAEAKGLDPDEYPTWAELATALQAEDDDGETADDDDGYDDMDLPALKNEAKSRGLVVKGTAEVLKARLRKHDAEEEPF